MQNLSTAINNTTNLSAQAPSFLAVAIGSLPHDDAKQALDLIFDKFSNCPFWPQLGNIDRREDMTRQYVQGLPGIEYDEERLAYYFNTSTDKYFEELEEFFLDYDSIMTEGNEELLDKYAITEPFSSSIKDFYHRISNMPEKPAFAKGHIIGALTWGTSLCDENGRCAFYDDVLKEIIIKGLTLKALWQIRELKKVSPETKMIIFMDEPTMSQYGTSALLTIEKSAIIAAVKEISDAIKAAGALSGVHCCGKTDWSIITETEVDILNFDAFAFSQSLALYTPQIENFVRKGSKIAWGLIPTLDAEALTNTDIQDLSDRFEKALTLMEQKGADRKLLLKNSIITPSCGAGGLSTELAERAMELTAELSENLKTIYEKDLLN